MASQSEEHAELNFTGESAEEAQDFVQAVYRRAYATGRQKDHAWIAEFACSRFSGKALLWYDTLNEETQKDWKLLRRAILGEFTPRPPAAATAPSAAPASVSSPSSPTPAAPPPSTVTVKIGRIRVYSEDRTKSGYLSLSPDRTEDVGIISADLSKANIVEADTLARTLWFQEGRRNLLIQGYSDNVPPAPQTPMYGCLMVLPGASRPQWNHTWSIAEDGSITATLLRTDGSQYDANFIVPSAVLDYIIHIPADNEAFLRAYGNDWTRVKLHLESLS